MKKIISILIILVIGILVLSGLGVAAVTNNNATMDNHPHDNHPPGKPKITGSRFVNPGTNEWTFKAIDPDGDNISYQIRWGDGNSEDWFGPFESGEEITRNHTYPKYGRVVIWARAKDMHGAIGEWGTFDLEISKSKQITNPIFFQFIGRFIKLFF